MARPVPRIKTSSSTRSDEGAGELRAAIRAARGSPLVDRDEGALSSARRALVTMPMNGDLVAMYMMGCFGLRGGPPRLRTRPRFMGRLWIFESG